MSDARDVRPVVRNRWDLQQVAAGVITDRVERWLSDWYIADNARVEAQGLWCVMHMDVNDLHLLFVNVDVMLLVPDIRQNNVRLLSPRAWACHWPRTAAEPDPEFLAKLVAVMRKPLE